LDIISSQVYLASMSMYLTAGHHGLMTQGGYASAFLSRPHSSAYVTSVPGVFTGYGSYHNAALAADVAVENPHDPIARAIAAKECVACASRCA
jgi:hypothetical protein